MLGLGRIGPHIVLLGCVIALSILTASLTKPAGPSLVLLGEQAAASLEGSGLTIGADPSALTVRVVADYECAACANLERDAGQTLRAWARQGRIRYQLLQAPLEAHRRARKAAVALYCADEAGNAWEMHTALVTEHTVWAWGPDPAASFSRYAGAAGIDRRQFEECLTSDRSKARVDGDRSAAKTIGVDGVPVIIVGSTLVRPSRSFREVLDYVETRLDDRS